MQAGIAEREGQKAAAMRRLRGHTLIPLLVLLTLSWCAGGHNDWPGHGARGGEGAAVPNSARDLYEKGMQLCLEGHKGRCIELLRQSLDIDGNQALACFNMGHALRCLQPLSP
jgi:hypothetical protein